MKMRTAPLSFVSTALAAGLLSISGWMALAPSAQAQILYTEDFNNGTTGTGAATNKAVIDTPVVWNSYTSSSATNTSTQNTTTTELDRTGTISGAISANSYIYAINGATPSQIFAVTQSGSNFTSSLVGGSLDAANVGNITWQMGNSSTAITARVMIQVEGSWYASSTIFSNASPYTANFQTSSDPDRNKSLTFDSTNSSWVNLTLNPGTSLALGSTPVANLSGAVTGIGFYITSGIPTGSSASTTRIDNLSIVAVPEPSTCALLLGGFVLLAGRRRNRLGKSA